MGKRITSQKRGKGSPAYKVPSFNFAGKVIFPRGETTAFVEDIIHCRGHTAPLAAVVYEESIPGLLIASEGVSVGDTLQIGMQADLKVGNTLSLSNIPEGTAVFNIEARPGDGGKFVRASGATAKVVSRSKDGVIVSFPSKKTKKFHPNCRATLGVAAGGGRPDKPFGKAGKKFYAMKAKNKYWPKVSGASMNAVDHPLGGSRSSRKGRPTMVPKNAPPGRVVGSLRARRTGRKKGK